MKHNIRKYNMLVTMLLLVTAMAMPVTGNAQVTLTYDSSSDGYDGETASNLFDGNTSTKWCYSAPSTSKSAWVVFKASQKCRLKGYTITTANDNTSSKGRNPKDWIIYGSNDKSEWTKLDSVSNDTKLQDENFTPYEYTLATGIATKYEYYKWEITANQGASVFQVSEFSITVPNCTEETHEAALTLINQRQVTCTKDGYTQDFYLCRSCGRSYSNEAGTTEINLESVTIPSTGHQFNGENGDCSMCGLSHMFSYAGTAADPFQISTANDLYWFAAWVNGTYTPEEGETAVTHQDACAVLMNDITVNTGVLDADGKLASDVSGFTEWTPIGIEGGDSSYNGTFDGQGHTVSGLYFNNSTTSCVGFFGFIDSDGKISNVGVVDSYFYGNNYIGVVCGYKFGTISNCYSAGAVSGNSYVGGVCGYNNSASISNCYSAGAVSGSDNVGGVCGYNYFSTISNCYFDSEKCDKDAVGNNNHSTVTNTSGKTTAQFESGEVCYLLNDSKSDGTLTWYQDLTADTGDKAPVLKSNGSNTVYTSLPCTSQFSNTGGITVEHVCDKNGFCSLCGGYEQATKTTEKYDINGDGTKDAVYEIANAGQLYWFAGLVNGTLTDGTAKNVSANAVLVNDITVNTCVLTAEGTLVSDVSSFTEWTPIGNSDNQYKGTFDGQSHTVSGLYFNKSTTNYVGFFGYIRSGGKISNVGVVDSYFNGQNYVGGVCGYSYYASISNCYHTGAVSGSSYVGGVCGCKYSGTISSCYSAGAVSGSTSYVGGVCGYNTSGTISNCYFDNEKCSKNVVGAGFGTVTNTEGKTTAQFASGEVCYLLNKGKTDGMQAWYQNLTAETGDKVPVLKSNDNNTVYASLPCTRQFSNTPVVIDHNLDLNGFCSQCGGYESATLTTDRYDINGDEEKDAVYEIANAGQLLWFAGLVNGTLIDGTTQNLSANAVLVKDIDFSTTNFTAIGKSSSILYAGTFDGNGHTVKVNQKESSDVALFGNIGACTIKNLTVTGTINTSVKYAAGIAMHIYGDGTTATIENCISDVTIESTVEGDGTHGGIIAVVDQGTLNINNCAFTGAINGSTTNKCGGFIGWTNQTSNISNSYVSATFDISSTSCNIVSRKGGTVTVTNCYYLNDLGDTMDGITKMTATQFASGEVCYLLNEGKTDGTQAWYQNLTAETGDKAPVLISNSKNTVYPSFLYCDGSTMSEGSGYNNISALHIKEYVVFDDTERIYKKKCSNCDHYVYCATSDGIVTATKEGDTFKVESFTLQDATPYDNRAVFTVNDFAYARTFEDTGWTTWYVPFDLKLTEELCNSYSFSRINNVHRYDDDEDGTPDRTEVEAFSQLPGVTLKANYPYLVRAKETSDCDMKLLLNSVRPAQAEENTCFCQSIDYKYSFTGTYSGKTGVGSGSEEPYSLQSNGEWTHQAEISPMRHYLTISSRTAEPQSSFARICLVVIGDETPTGVVIPYSNEKRQAETYDLSGRLTDSNQRGIVIKNGKKIINNKD